MPTAPSAPHTASNTVRPFSDARPEGRPAREVAIERKMLFRHSSALTCIAPSADVVGAWGDGAPTGGNDSAVGCTNFRSGATRVVKNAGGGGA